MTDDQGPRFASVVEEYARLEPHGADTWNPLRSERELLHRVTLYEQLCLALARRGGEVTELRVLDVGCGNGRSTRVYLDFGMAPEQLTGVDLRATAIAAARRHHGGIRYLAYDGRALPLDDASVDWVSACTVMSSIPPGSARRHLTAEIARVLAPGGDVFYWDRGRAQEFAGGDELEPTMLFASLAVVSDERVRIQGDVGRFLPGRVVRNTLLPLVDWLAPRRTHRVCQLRKPT